MKKKLLFSEPVGPSAHEWSNQGLAVYESGATCGLCGTEYPGVDFESGNSSITISCFLGRQVVEDCCGRVLDLVYKESGEVMARKFLEDFAKNPTDQMRFLGFASFLSRCLQEANDNLQTVTEEVIEAEQKLISLEEKIKPV